MSCDAHGQISSHVAVQCFQELQLFNSFPLPSSAVPVSSSESGEGSALRKLLCLLHALSVRRTNMNPVIPNNNIPGILAMNSPNIIGFPSPPNPGTIFGGPALTSLPAKATPTVVRVPVFVPTMPHLPMVPWRNIDGPMVTLSMPVATSPRAPTTPAPAQAVSTLPNNSPTFRATKELRGDV
ncbi:hypothetical protein NDU88_001457 [Pleurodeles waltl]|uniref:Uncharacterized protein n=1 Tax=Pleurodeles waltl TaxID=8319 RepID=A0AAV7VWX0_PLEWA|nr:hypothetical protein NDU88_001457 [Pleurodeles waltl]